MRLRFTLSIILLGFLLAAVAFSPPPAVEASTIAPADTLRFEVTAGQSLVVPLPGPADASFRGIRMPALSLLVDRSFAWKTLPGEEGREYVLIQRRAGARVDTLLLAIDVQ